ncbi:MAG: acetyl-CoA decarbonylase/synthase complex subunit gamma [Methanomicrobiales archaeon]|nr:acetyl-CoA decarbonylase/synthase complex subunit gamma [Methanomicrobiales archaeon]
MGPDGDGLMATVQKRRSIREISPIDVYRVLPGTNCGECGEGNCMAFATRLVNGEVQIEGCPPLRTPDYHPLFLRLEELLAPPVRRIVIGQGEKSLVIGGKYVLQRHELTYHHPPPLALDIADTMGGQEMEERVNQIRQFSYTYIGRTLTLDAIAVRSVSGNPGVFAAAVQKVASLSDFPLILCTPDPVVMAAGVRAIPGKRPLLHAASRTNWKEMATLAREEKCPLVVHAPGDIALLRSLTRTLQKWGVEDLVLDPGTFVGTGMADTLNTFTLIRRAACRDQDELLGYPLLGTPIAAWAADELSPEMARWKETITTSLLLSRYADLLILHSMEGWSLLPHLVWRFNLYTDPRKPVSVEAGVREFGSPSPDSPVLLTTNYALTFFTVESDIKQLDCYLIVVDTGGISVESAVAGRYLTADTIAAAVKESGIADRVKHRFLILPGLAARLSGEVGEISGWNVLVGPKDSSGIPQYLKDRWPPEEESA